MLPPWRIKCVELCVCYVNEGGLLMSALRLRLRKVCACVRVRVRACIHGCNHNQPPQVQMNWTSEYECGGTFRGSTPPSGLKQCVLAFLPSFLQWLHRPFVPPPLVSLNGMVLFLQILHSPKPFADWPFCSLSFSRTSCLSAPQYGSSCIVLYLLRLDWKTCAVESGSVLDKSSFLTAVFL